jgi:hypothetical protein
LKLYKKYNKIVVQFDSENWTLNENLGGVDGIFIDKYSKMINQLNGVINHLIRRLGLWVIYQSVIYPSAKLIGVHSG